MFVYNSLHYFPNTTYKRYRCVIRRNEESPFLNTALTWANFQFVGYLLWWSDLLNIICKGNAILFGHSFNILWLMTSGPDALFGWRICIISEISWIKSLHQSKYPTNWKLAHVIAVFKKGDSSLPSNYRPISLISCVGKIMERVIYKHVYNYLHQNKLIYGTKLDININP
jgi:hypothetical protein